MLVLHEYDDLYNKMTPEETQAVVEHYWRWTKQIKDEGYCLTSEALQYSRTMVRNEAEHMVVDGPFTETKEIIAGFYLIEAADNAEAVEVAKGCPVLAYGGAVEVREIMEM